MPEIKTGNAGNQAQGGRALSSQPVFHAQFPVGKQEYAEFGQAPYVWLIKFHLICLAVILLSFLMQAITEQNYLCCACVSGASALLCGSYDIQAERKSIYDDLDALARFGVDVQCRKGRSPGWFVGGRDFELPELKLLVDAVQSSRFITRKKSDALIRKLERLASVYQARQLQRQVFVSGRVKVMNESIYFNVDRLHTAIAARRAITFQYFDYDLQRKKVLRRGGQQYAVSPYGLIWNSDNYYLVAYDSANREMRHYRVDKMTGITVTDKPLEGTEQYSAFDIAVYGQKHFGMYSGEEMTVTLRGTRAMVGVVLDRFGQDVILVPDGPEHFTVSIPLVLSPQFFGWLFALEPELTLVAPPQAVDQYRERLRLVQAQYRQDQ